MPPVLIAVVGIVGALVTGFFTYAIARRNTSGDVKTTDAGKLWDEATNIRKELRDELVQLRTESAERDARIAGQDARLAAQDAKIEVLTEQHQSCLDAEAALRREIAELRAKQPRTRRPTT